MSRTPLANELILNDRDEQDVLLVAELNRILEPIVRMRVAPALRHEHAEVGSRLLVDEAVLAVDHVLGVSPEDHEAVAEVRNAVARALTDPTDLDSTDIDEHAADVAAVMVMAWVQFLDLALGRQSQLRLGANLLPGLGDADGALFERLRASLATTVIRPREAQDEIMGEFANALLASSSQRVVLPRRMAIECTANGIVVTRTGSHSASAISSATPAPLESRTKR